MKGEISPKSKKNKTNEKRLKEVETVFAKISPLTYVRETVRQKEN